MSLSYKVRGAKKGIPVLRQTYGNALISAMLENKVIRPSVGHIRFVYYEACINKEDAEARGLYLKSGVGKRHLKIDESVSCL